VRKKKGGKMRFKFIIRFLTGVLAPSLLLAVTPPAWPTFHQNPQRTGLSPYSGPQSMNTVHTFQTGGDLAWSSPVIDFDNETIYIGCEDGKLYAITLDGILKWTYQTGGPIFSCPAISEEGVIFIGSTDSSVYALEDSITYPKLKWSYKTNDKIKTPILLGTDGSVYVFGGELYALDADGNLKWTYHTGISYPGGGALALDGTTIYTPHVEALNIYVAAIDTNGTEKWKCDLGPPSFSFTTPTVGSDGTIYWAHLDAPGVGRIIAINPDGTIDWRSDSIGGIQFSSPAIATDGTIYVGSASGLNAINLDGTLKWVFPTDGAVYSSPAVDNEGTIYFGTYDSIFYAVDSDGNLKWDYQTGGLIATSSPAIDVSGKVWVGASDGNLYSFAYSSRIVEGISSPVSFTHLQVSPNPFREITEIRFGMHDVGCRMEDISLQIYDVSGRLVRSFSSFSSHSSLIASVTWDGTDDSGKKVQSGVYFCRLIVGDYQATKKLLFFR